MQDVRREGCPRNEYNVCPGCGEVGRATTPPSSRSFRLTHEATCGTPVHDGWLGPLHVSWDVAESAVPVDLRDVVLSSG